MNVRPASSSPTQPGRCARRCARRGRRRVSKSTPWVPTLSPVASMVSRLRGSASNGWAVLCVWIFFRIHGFGPTYAKPTPPTFHHIYSRSRKESSRLEGMSPATAAAAAAASGPTAATAVGRGLVVCCKVYVSEVRPPVS